MSMLTAQVGKLRDRARELRRGRWLDGADDARLLDDAADTIENLRGRLTEQTCINVADPPEEGFWPMPHFKCFVCGAYYVTDKYVYYCPNCGRKVVG